MYRGHNRAVYVSANSKEATYDSAQTIDTELRLTSPPVKVKKEMENDLDEIGGLEESTQLFELAQSAAFELTQSKCRPATLAFIAAYAMGSVASAQEGVFASYKHSFTPQSGFDLPSFTFHDYVTSGFYKKYTGCFLDGFTLSVARKGFWNISAPGFGSGTIAAGSGSAAVVSESPMRAGDAKVWYSTGGFGDPSTQSKTTSDLGSTLSDITARIIDANWGYNNNVPLDECYAFNGAGVLSRAIRGRRNQSFNCTLEFDASGSEVDHFLNQQALSFEIESYNSTLVAAGGAQYYGFDLIFPQLKIKDANPVGGPNDTITCPIEFEVMESAAYGSALLDVYNAQAAYAG